MLPEVRVEAKTRLIITLTWRVIPPKIAGPINLATLRTPGWVKDIMGLYLNPFPINSGI